MTKTIENDKKKLYNFSTIYNNKKDKLNFLKKNGYAIYIASSSKFHISYIPYTLNHFISFTSIFFLKLR